MFLSPELDIFLANCLGFIELEQEQEDDFEFFTDYTINMFQSLLDLPAFVAVSQEPVKKLMLVFLFPTN